MTTTLDIGIPKKNIEGYPDPTCYKALKEIQHTEYGYRPLVYICSPYSGDVEANVELARRFSAFTVSARQIPLAPHLHYPQFMDDTDNPADWITPETLGELMADVAFLTPTSRNHQKGVVSARLRVQSALKDTAKDGR